MKSVILGGSPNKHGQTNFIVNEIQKNLEGEVFFYDFYRMNISGCTDCRYCWKNQDCSIKTDGMLEIYKNIEEADNIIIASPLHFGTLTGELLRATSRFQTYWSAKYIRKDEKVNMKRKKGALILTAGAKWHNMFLIPEGSAHFIFEHINTDLKERIYLTQTDKFPCKDNLELKKEIVRITNFFNSKQ